MTLANQASLELLDLAKLFRKTVQFYIRADEVRSDLEGATLKRHTLSRIEAAIAEAETSAEKEKTSALSAMYFCLTCRWHAADVDGCTYSAEEIFVDNVGDRFCATCANEYRNGTKHMRLLSSILSSAEPHLEAGVSKSDLMLSARWLPIAGADRSVAYRHDLGELKIGCSYPLWVRDADGRAYEALWSDNGKKAYWWDIDGESPVNPVEFMPHPLSYARLSIDSATQAEGVDP
ncbi:hypothetical protein [Rhizobium rhizogenes]|uniref:Uncharacterized protein n=1 Tax=Rhizobium rhizogenes TaxID=359 RepID=A0AA92C5F8_RHIRH|nr:hypothetical protein [Rhizobium rhizogenes]PVE56323.1 hypothetical protein DC430_00495 [Rhizobium rhizogenes]PVE64818.1 hypothetical protein DC415_13695 [Agrobacterium tumefaciens]PVE73956.1 hypothetical protein DCP16_13695 [Sphingomonas sp. TPD3009]